MAGAEPSRVRTVVLATPPVRCIVPRGTFGAFGWCASDELEWRSPVGVWDTTTPIDGSDPARMVFVTRGPGAFLPRELACLHATGMGLSDEQALAPWAIDDATDGLFERRVRPRDALWLAADNLNALFWGLHDWAHFHNHGDFEPRQRPWTELQCDVTALAWLWHNRRAIPLQDAQWARTREQVERVNRGRFEEQVLALDASPLAATAVQALLGD